MLHIVGFRDGNAFYRKPLCPHRRLPCRERGPASRCGRGLAEPVQLARRDEGWGARTRMKDASSTDVIVHRGVSR